MSPAAAEEAVGILRRLLADAKREAAAHATAILAVDAWDDDTWAAAERELVAKEDRVEALERALHLITESTESVSGPRQSPPW